MGFSSFALEQREKEAEALKSFLAFSLIGSLALHIGVLTFGIGNLLTRVPELTRVSESQEEPMEVTIIDPPSPPALEPKQEAELADSDAGGGGSVASGGGGGGTPSAAAPSSIAIAPSQPKSVANVPRQIENSKTPVPQQKPAQTLPSEIATEPKPVITPSAPNSLPLQTVQQNRDLVTALRSRERPSSTESTGTSGVGNAADDGLRQSSSVAARTGSGGSGSGTGTGSGGSGSGTGTGSGGSGSGTGTGSGSGSGSAVATGSGTARRGDGNGDGSGRLGCRKCSKPKYPESARRQGVEGSAKIKVDVDDKGNVTNVRIAESTGNADLDEAAIRAARRWKFDTPDARQGVTAKVDFAIEGSERSRQVRERQRKREASRRQRASENATRTPAAPRTLRSAATGTTSSTPQRRRRVQTATPRGSQQATPQRRRSAPPATSSQRSLLESLRRHQQKSPPVPEPSNSAPSGANQ